MPAARPILVTGSHRSGTTWVGRVLAMRRTVAFRYALAAELRTLRSVRDAAPWRGTRAASPPSAPAATGRS